jgi:hypothetical protein
VDHGYDDFLWGNFSKGGSKGDNVAENAGKRKVMLAKVWGRRRLFDAGKS